MLRSFIQFWLSKKIGSELVAVFDLWVESMPWKKKQTKMIHYFDTWVEEKKLLNFFFFTHEDKRDKLM